MCLDENKTNKSHQKTSRETFHYDALRHEIDCSDRVSKFKVDISSKFKVHIHNCQ